MAQVSQHMLYVGICHNSVCPSQKYIYMAKYEIHMMVHCRDYLGSTIDLNSLKLIYHEF